MSSFQEFLLHIRRQVNVKSSYYILEVCKPIQGERTRKGASVEKGMNNPRKKEERYIFPRRSFSDNFNSQGGGMEVLTNSTLIYRR